MHGRGCNADVSHRDRPRHADGVEKPSIMGENRLLPADWYPAAIQLHLPRLGYNCSFALQM